jgi:hypothetical protein
LKILNGYTCFLFLRNYTKVKTMEMDLKKQRKQKVITQILITKFQKLNNLVSKDIILYILLPLFNKLDIMMFTVACFPNLITELGKTTKAMNKCAEYGYLDLMKWGRNTLKCPWDSWTCSYAAKGGQLKVLQWARENGCPWNKWTCNNAAGGGHLEVLKWARQNGCPWTEWICNYAALGGHLEVLKWARENGCPWDKWTCTNAAQGGHLEVLKWARENGCPWDSWTCAYASLGGHLEVLKWARENGCPE